MNTDICGNWKLYSKSIRKGWMYPCYYCNSLTGTSIKRNFWELWVCRFCVGFETKKSKILITKIFKKIIEHEEDIEHEKIIKNLFS